MSTAIRNTKIRKNLQEAHRWLRDQGYVQHLPSGRISISEGVHV